MARARPRTNQPTNLSNKPSLKYTYTEGLSLQPHLSAIVLEMCNGSSSVVALRQNLAL